MSDGGDHRQASDIPILDLDNLKVISVLGRGGKGVVFLVENEASQLFALKVISRSSIENKNKKKMMKQSSGNSSSDGRSEYRRVCFEQEVLNCFHHPLLPKLRGALSTEKIVGYAIDYCPGGDLHSLRIKQTEKMFSDDIIRFYAAELVLALEYLHGLGIVYRDLKPDNVMIQESGHLMLVDFDLSTKLTIKPCVVKSAEKQSENVKKKKKKKLFGGRSNSNVSPENVTELGESVVSKSNSFVGTDEYMAPEIIQGKGHDFAVDWWCLGVMLYEMLYGVTPFKGINRKETYYRILTKSPELTGEMTPLRDLIGKLLEKDPKERISSVEKIKGHDFFMGVDWNVVMDVSRPPFIPNSNVEDRDGNNEIDVEVFVQGVFQIKEEEEKHVTQNDAARLDGFDNQNNFLVF